VIALAEDSPRSVPPPPFREFADGSGWALRRADFAEARDIARGANGPLPLLTTIGTTSALDLALTTNSRTPADAYGLSTSLLFAVDLEIARVVSVRAPDESSTVEALTMMALELATSETADQLEIVCVGFGHRLATFDRVMVVDEVGEILEDLETVAGRAVYAEADASPFATRVGNGAADTWNPVVVFHVDRPDPNREVLIELAERTEGGVTAVCGYPTGTGWSLEVAGDRVRCPDLPGDLATHEFTRPALDGVELVAELLDEPFGDVELDDEFWSPMPDGEPDRTWELWAEDHTSWRPMTTVSADRTDPLSDPQSDQWSSVAVADRPDPEATDGPVPGQLRHSVEHRPIDDDPSDDDSRPVAPPEPSRDEPIEDEGGDRLVGGRHLFVVDGWGGSTVDPEQSESEPETDIESPAETQTRTDAEPELEPVAGPDDAPVPQDDVADRTTEDRSVDHDRSEDVEPDEPSSIDDAGPAELVEPVDPAPTIDPEPPPAQARPFTLATPRPVTAEAGELRISVLGEFTIGGSHIVDRGKPWKYTKTPELILYLLLHPGGASQDLLMEQLFPEQPPNRPRLNQLVSDARTKALGKNRDGDYHLPHASPTEPFYKLLPTVSLDLRDFARYCAAARQAERPEDEIEAWQSALALVRGRPFTLPNDGYEWALPEIEATIVKVEEAAMRLADLAIETGDHELAVWATKQGLLTGTGYYELLAKRGRAALLLQDPEEIVRAFADLQLSLHYTGAPEEGTPDLSVHPELQEVYDELSSEGRGQDRT
ncbi:MAG: hypothetical protein AAF547_20815, partial [Actinomycetota bacterium]